MDILVLTTEKEYPTSDNLKRYCAQKALKSLRPTEPKGQVTRHLNTLTMLISGIIGSQKCPLPALLGNDLLMTILVCVKRHLD